MDDDAAFAESQILRLAQETARRLGDPAPSLIQHAVGTREEANHVMTHGENWVPGDDRSYLIAIKGSFSSIMPTPPMHRKDPPEIRRWSVQMLVVDAATGQVTDSGGSNDYPDLESLGRVVTDDPTPTGGDLPLSE